MSLRQNTGAAAQAASSDASINPLTMKEDDTEQYFHSLYLCEHFSEFKKDALYRAPAPHHKICNFTHRLIPCKRGDNDFFEVVGHEYPGTGLLETYDILGTLELKNKVWCFVPHPNTLSLRFTKCINPAYMSVEESRLLGAMLLRVEREVVYLPAGVSSIYIEGENDNRLFMHMNLQRAITARCNSDGEQLRFEVLGEEIGKGANSHIFRTLGTLVPQSDGSLRKKITPRIIKQQDFLTEKWLRKALGLIESEFQTASLVTHLHVKRPAVINGDRHISSFMAARWIEGESLGAYIGPKATLNLTGIAERLGLSIALIRALEWQVHTRQVVHLDVKPDNILIRNPTGLQPLVYYIDTGLSKKNNVEITYSRGTPFYISPEVLLGQNATAAADVFSLGVVVGLIWGAKLNDRLFTAQNMTAFLKTLFTKIVGLTEDDKIAIADVIKKMCLSVPAERCSLAEAASIFDNIRFARLPDAQAIFGGIALRRTRESARQLRQRLHDDALLCGETRWNIDAVSEEIRYEIIKIKNTPALVSEFVASLDCAVFYGMTDINIICRKLENLTDNYNLAAKELRAAAAELLELIQGKSFKTFTPGYQHHLQRTHAKAMQRIMSQPRSLDEAGDITTSRMKSLDRIHMDLLHHEMNREQNVDVPTPALVYPLPDRKLPAHLCKLFSKPAAAVNNQEDVEACRVAGKRLSSVSK